MFGSLARLITKADVLPPVIALVLGVPLAGLVTAIAHSPGARLLGVLIVAAAVLGVIGSRTLRLAARYRRLMRGRCPHPGCRGVVQRSERLGKGWVVCPTCKDTWPELEGMKFRLTSRA